MAKISLIAEIEPSGLLKIAHWNVTRDFHSLHIRHIAIKPFSDRTGDISHNQKFKEKRSNTHGVRGLFITLLAGAQFMSAQVISRALEK
jgi:hypothetical protein